MRADPFSSFAPRPHDIAEWEDLLVRFELGPRALRTVLEEAATGGAELPAEAGRLAAAQLAHLHAREADAASWLRALSRASLLEPWVPDTVPEAGVRDTWHHLSRYTELRGRNFAWVQRRGLEVWDWQSLHPVHGSVSAFQLVAYLVRHDGRHLACIRDALRAASPC